MDTQRAKIKARGIARVAAAGSFGILACTTALVVSPIVYAFYIMDKAANKMRKNPEYEYGSNIVPTLIKAPITVVGDVIADTKADLAEYDQKLAHRRNNIQNTGR